jgi:hypothetical protein
MELIADILMVAGTLSVAIYCIVLTRRLSRFTDLEKGVGGAIAILSAQVDDLSKMLLKAQSTASESGKNLENLTRRSEAAAKRLELLMASMHDLPEPTKDKPPTLHLKESDIRTERSSVATHFQSRRGRAEAAE